MNAPHDQAWYTAISRLTGYTAFEHWAAHYPGQAVWYGVMGAAADRLAIVSARCRALGLTQEKIMDEMDKPPRIMYAAALKDRHGDLAFFAGPNPSLQALRGTIPPEGLGMPYLVKLEGDTVTPVARWDAKTQQWRKKEKK